MPPTNRTSRRSALTQAVRGDGATLEKQVFNFDFVYGDGGLIDDRNSQEKVFSELGSIVLDNAFSGFNCSLLAYGQTGAGKCFAADTPLMMADGSTRMAQDVCEGDQLMGDDGQPRTVLPRSLVRGKGPLKQIRTESSHHTGRFVVNLEHILPLMVTQGPSPITHSLATSHTLECFSFDVWTLNSHQILRAHRHTFSTSTTAREAHSSFCAAWTPFLWEVPVRVFLNTAQYPSAHPLHVSAEARAACRMFQPASVSDKRSPGVMCQAIRTLYDDVDVTDDLVSESAWAIGLWLARPLSAQSLAETESAAVARLRAWSGLLPSCTVDESAQLAAPGSHLHRILDHLHLLSNPHLLSQSHSKPIDLLRDDQSVRSYLLAGLLEGSGGADAAGTFSTTQLAGVTWLCRSLGLRVETIDSPSPIPHDAAFFTLTGPALHSLPFTSRERTANAITKSSIDTDEQYFTFQLDDWMDGTEQPYFGFAVDGNQRFLTADWLCTHNSHSMMGYRAEQTLHAASAQAGLDCSGLIPRLSAALFARINENEDPNISYKIEVSYLEIYSEKIYDLQDKTKKNLQVRQHPKLGAYVENLTLARVSNYKQLEARINAGNLERTVAATNMNDKSSRSHAVFTIVFTTTHVDREVKLQSDVVSKIQLVDLSGSERAEFSGATGIRLKEAAQINQSLTTLGRVVSALALRSQMGNKKGAAATASDPHFIPYRDSVLTWLLSQSLGGNSKTLMIAAVSPADQSFEETLSTLRYASRAKNIVNAAVINEDPNGELIRNLRGEIDALRAQLSNEKRGVELGDESAKLVEKLRLQLLDNAMAMRKMEELYQAKLIANERAAEEMAAEHAKQAALNAAELAIAAADRAQREAEAQERERENLREREAAALREKEREKERQAVLTIEVAEDLSATPFLVNLSERPAPGEAVLHHLRDGITVLGRRDSQVSPDEQQVQLLAAGVRDRHASLVIENGTVTLRYHPPAVLAPDVTGLKPDLFVNSAPLFASRVLVHGDRILLGSSAFYRFSCSKQELERVMAKSSSPSARTGFKGISIHTFKKKTESPASVPTPPIVVHKPTPAPAPRGTAMWCKWQDTHSASGGVMDLMVSRESRLVPKHKQRRPIVSPLATLPANQIALVADALLQWRYRLLRHRMDDEAMSLAFLVDESNAICSAMGLSERYRVELHSRCVPGALFAAGSGIDFEQPPLDASPLTRLRSLRQVTLGVVSWRKRGAPVVAAIWDRAEFADQLLLLRAKYAETMEADAGDALNTSAPIHSARIQLIGSALAYLEPLRFGCRLRHAVPVLDRRGELAGYLTVDLSIEAVDALRAQIEMERDEKDEANALDGDDDLLPSDDEDEEAASSMEITDRKPLDPASSLLALTVRIVSFDASPLASKTKLPLSAQGCHALHVRYCVHDDPHLFTTAQRRLRNGSPASTTTAAQVAAAHKTQFNYRKTHYLGGSTLSAPLMDYLSLDAMSFDILGRFEEEPDEFGDAERPSPSPSLSSVASPLSPTTKTSSLPHGSAATTRVFEAFTHGGDIMNGDSDDESSMMRGGSASCSRVGSREGSRIGSPLRDSRENPLDLLDFATPPPAVAPSAIMRPSLARGTSGSMSMPRFGRSTPIKILASPNAHQASSRNLRSPVESSQLHQSPSIGEDASDAFFASANPFNPSHSTPFAAKSPEINGPPIAGRKSADHLLYACVDVEEEDPNKGGAWANAPLKTEDDGTQCFRLTSFRPKKLVFSLLQVDHDSTFIIESLASVSVKKLQRQRGSARADYDIVSGRQGGQPLTLTLIEQFAHSDHRLLVATCDFGQVLLDHDLLREETREGDRVRLTLDVVLYFAATTQSVTIPIELLAKVYKKSPSTSSLFSKKPIGGQSDPSRLAKLGQHYIVSRQATCLSVASVYIDHARSLQRQSRRIRHDQITQHASFLRQLKTESRELDKEAKAAGESTTVRQPKQLPKSLVAQSTEAFTHTMDSCLRLAPPATVVSLSPPASPTGAAPLVTKAFSFGLAASAARVGAQQSATGSGIQVVVEQVNRANGIKCGFLSKQSGMGKVGPSAVTQVDSAMTPATAALVASVSTKASKTGKWSPKWCVLRPPYLFYFQKRTDIREKGIITLFGAKFELNKDLAHSFFIHTPTRSYHLQAASAKEMVSWLKSMATAEMLISLGLAQLPTSPIVSPVNSPMRKLTLNGNNVASPISPNYPSRRSSRAQSDA